MAYLSVGEFKAYKGITDTLQDGLILEIITAARQYIDTYTRRTFSATEDTIRYFDAVRDVEEKTLHLDRDLCVITEITNGNGEVIAPTEYVTEPRNEPPFYAITLKMHNNTAWMYTGSPENAIAVEGRWAYSTTANEDVKHAARVLVNYYYSQKDSGTFEAVAYPESGMIEVPHGIAATVHAILHPYRRLVR